MTRFFIFINILWMKFSTSSNIIHSFMRNYNLVSSFIKISNRRQISKSTLFIFKTCTICIKKFKAPWITWICSSLGNLLLFCTYFTILILVNFCKSDCLAPEFLRFIPNQASMAWLLGCLPIWYFLITFDIYMI